jgi:hypothetical protein
LRNGGGDLIGCAGNHERLALRGVARRQRDASAALLLDRLDRGAAFAQNGAKQFAREVVLKFRHNQMDAMRWNEGERWADFHSNLKKEIFEDWMAMMVNS